MTDAAIIDPSKDISSQYQMSEVTLTEGSKKTGLVIEGDGEVTIYPPDHTAEPNADWDAATPDPGTSKAPYRIYNIGNQQPVELMDYIGAVEKALGKEAVKNLLPLQPGDVPDTWADTTDLANDVGYQPATPVEVGVKNFVDWYLDFYK